MDWARFHRPRRAKKDQEGYPRLESGGINGKEVNWVFVIISKKEAYVFVLWRARIEIICAYAYWEYSICHGAVMLG